MLMSLIFIVIVLLYMLPTYLAFRHKSRDKWLILILNVWLGWTLLFWILLTAWALTTAEI